MLLGLGKYRLLIEVVETSRHFPGQLEVRQLILPYRNEIRFVQEDVGGLEDWIAQKAVGAEILFLDLLLFFLVGRIALQPGHGNHHGEQ